ncbi:unnamed protein product, partial [Pelagomonas calceolata]
AAEHVHAAGHVNLLLLFLFLLLFLLLRVAAATTIAAAAAAAAAAGAARLDDEVLAVVARREELGRDHGPVGLDLVPRGLDHGLDRVGVDLRAAVVERERREAHAVLVLLGLRETRERHFFRLKYLSPSRGTRRRLCVVKRYLRGKR